jgi:hypothetical protein
MDVKEGRGGTTTGSTLERRTGSGSAIASATGDVPLVRLDDGMPTLGTEAAALELTVADTGEAGEAGLEAGGDAGAGLEAGADVAGDLVAGAGGGAGRADGVGGRGSPTGADGAAGFVAGAGDEDVLVEGAGDDTCVLSAGCFSTDAGEGIPAFASGAGGTGSGRTLAGAGCAGGATGRAGARTATGGGVASVRCTLMRMRKRPTWISSVALTASSAIDTPLSMVPSIPS